MIFECHMPKCNERECVCRSLKKKKCRHIIKDLICKFLNSMKQDESRDVLRLQPCILRPIPKTPCEKHHTHCEIE